MRRLFRRSMIWFLPVVIIPVGALLVMQYRFLRTLEQKSVSAERNWQRSAIEAVATDVDARFRRDAAAALTLTHVQLVSVGTLGKHFREHRVPGVRRYFAVEFHGNHYTGQLFDPNGVEVTADWSESEAVKLSTMAWHMAYKWERLVQPDLQVDERDRHHRVILRPVVDASMRVVGVAGVMLDPKLALPKVTHIASELFMKRHPSRSVNIRVGPNLPTQTPRGRDFISQPLHFVFTDWRVGVRDACTSPEELAAVQFRHNMMWTGGAFVVLLGGIGLAGGSVARQMRLSQMKSDFVSNVSHELRTPLSSIRVFGEYMRLGRVNKQEKIQEYGEYIEAESRRLTQLINNILDFSKIESAEKKYRFCPIDVIELVEQTVAGFEMPLRDAGVAITFAWHGTRPPLMQMDKDAIAQVLMNLLDNAVKYSNGNKSIEVTVRSTAKDVSIAVRDHGIGIPAAERKKIFEKFYRVGSGLVHDVKGSGLGLSIVEHVAKAHGGHVQVQSEVGEGSTFTIVLPIREKAEAGEMTQEIA